MALNQFGAVMTFAIEMEDQLAEFYDALAKAGGSNAGEFSERAAGSRKRSSRLETSRRQNVTEITLEPIEGLDEADYALDLAANTAEAINALEALVCQFYTDVTPKINVRETRQVLQRNLKEHNRMDALSD
jgi:hypothetical protein